MAGRRHSRGRTTPRRPGLRGPRPHFRPSSEIPPAALGQAPRGGLLQPPLPNLSVPNSRLPAAPLPPPPPNIPDMRPPAYPVPAPLGQTPKGLLQLPPPPDLNVPMNSRRPAAPLPLPPLITPDLRPPAAPGLNAPGNIPGMDAACSIWSPNGTGTPAWHSLLGLLLGQPEPGKDHEQAALAPVSEEEEALLQEGGRLALEIAGAVLAESGEDDHDRNVLDGHNNVINQDQLQSITKSVAMPGSTSQVKNDETGAVEMINDRMDFVIDHEKVQDAFWDEILHAGGDHEAGDDGNVEVNNDGAGANAEPVLAQPDDVNIGDQGDANVEVIKDDHEELPNDANIGNGGGMHEADQGDHQKADVIAAHDYPVEAVKDDEVLHDESEPPVGEQAAASNVDVNIGEGAVHDQHQAAGDVNGDGLPMHDGDQGGNANVEEVVGKADEVHGEPVPRQIMIGSISVDMIDGAGIVHNAAGDQAAGNNKMVLPELKCDDEVEFTPPLRQQPQQQRDRRGPPPGAQQQQQQQPVLKFYDEVVFPPLGTQPPQQRRRRLPPRAQQEQQQPPRDRIQ